MKLGRAVSFGLLLGLTLLTLRCAPAKEVAVDGTFTLGIFGPFSGPDEHIGDEFRHSAALALESTDYQIGGHPIEVVWIDSQSNPGRASRAYEQAVLENGVEAGVLNWDSLVAVNVMQVAAEHQVPHFFGLGATGVINDRFESDPETYGYWSTKGWPTPVNLSVSYVRALEEAIAAGIWSPEGKTVAIYGEDTDWGRSFGEGLATHLEAAGWQIIDREYFSLEQREFAPYLEELQAEAPDLIAGTSTVPAQISALLNQMEDFGLDSVIIADGLGSMANWYELTGEASDYVLDQRPDWTTDRYGQFAAAFEERSGSPPSPAAGGLAFDGMNFFIKVLRATSEERGGLGSGAVYRTIQEEVWTGDLTYASAEGAVVMQEYSFGDPPDPLVGVDYYVFPVVQLVAGEAVNIWPARVAQSDLTIPE